MKRICAALAAALLWSTASLAQGFPNRPVKMIVPFPAGGSADLVSRVTAAKMSAALGQPVVIENHPGAGGRLGLDLTSKAAPTGYTIGLGTTSTLALAPVLYSKLPYDPKSFAPIGLVIEAPVVIVENAAVPARSVQELIALARARPGKLNFASIGPGTQHHVSGENFKLLTGVDIVHVPYAGAAPALVALLADEVQLMFDILASFQLENFQSGKLRALAVAGPQRIKSLPDVPTAAEAGLPEFQSTAWFALVAPSGTPPDIIGTLNQALQQALASPEVIDTVEQQGLNTAPGTPQQLADKIATETDRWGKVIAATGFKLE